MFTGANVEHVKSIVFETLICTLALAHTRCMILGKILKALRLNFTICKVGCEYSFTKFTISTFTKFTSKRTNVYILVLHA